MSFNEPVLRMSGVSKTFPIPGGRLTAVNDVNFELKKGDFIGISGPSGSGKSTFLQLAGLLSRPCVGDVEFDGINSSKANDELLAKIRKERIGYVFQRPFIFGRWTVYENVLFRFRYLDADVSRTKEKVIEALSMVGLEGMASMKAASLSGGEIQRMDIARSIAMEPAAIIADEPTGNLDQNSATRVMEIFTRLNNAGATIMFVTHNMALIDYCTRHAVCQNGRLLEMRHAPR